MEILVIFGGMVAAVWAANLLRFAGLAGVFTTVLFVGSCLSYPVFKVGPITLDRLMLAGLVVFYVIMQCQTTGAVFRFTWPDLLMVSFLLVMAYSTFRCDWRANDNRTAVNLVVFYLMPAAMYWMAKTSRFEEQQVAFLFTFFALFGSYLGLTGLAERFDIHSLVFPRYIISPFYPEFLGRARGPFLNPCANGLFLTAGLASAILSWQRLGLLGRILMMIAGTLCIVGIACTMTRSVWIGAVLAISILMTALLPKQLRFGFVIAGTLIGGVVLFGTWSSLQSFKRDKNVSVEDMEKSAALRPMLAIVATEMFRERPIFGCGFGQYLEESLPYFSARISDKPIEMAKSYVQHNVVLSLLTETGLVGTSLYVVMLATWLITAGKLVVRRGVSLAKRQQGLLFLCVLCSFCVSGTFQDMTIVNMAHMLLFFLSGFVMSLNSITRPVSVTSRGRPSSWSDPSSSSNPTLMPNA